ncbi:hypothetical protein MA16_Dca025533 [Dendrobium catenatum]|uniref:Uncharacterized protein n=1 Tax=Dendrobium catenatum TaxID=906689 RepID=A0A2I0VX81_9ASPA|nr:hypothetical protein MA16_Dca025533 [Dendrobium catenatum]
MAGYICQKDRSRRTTEVCRAIVIQRWYERSLSVGDGARKDRSQTAEAGMIVVSNGGRKNCGTATTIIKGQSGSIIYEYMMTISHEKIKTNT